VRLRGRQKQGQLYVTQAEGVADTRAELRNRDQRHNRPGDEVPVVGQAKRDDRLYVQDVQEAVVGSDTEMEVALKGDRDQIRDGVLRLLREILGFLGTARLRTRE
jgi:hypothetical protein